MKQESQFLPVDFGQERIDGLVELVSAHVLVADDASGIETWDDSLLT